MLCLALLVCTVIATQEPAPKCYSELQTPLDQSNPAACRGVVDQIRALGTEFFTTDTGPEAITHRDGVATVALPHRWTNDWCSIALTKKDPLAWDDADGQRQEVKTQDFLDAVHRIFVFCAYKDDDPDLLYLPAGHEAFSPQSPYVVEILPSSEPLSRIGPSALCESTLGHFMENERQQECWTAWNFLSNGIDVQHLAHYNYVSAGQCSISWSKYAVLAQAKNIARYILWQCVDSAEKKHPGGRLEYNNIHVRVYQGD